MRKHTIDAMLTRIAAGDNEAFERLYIETKRGVYAFVYTYLGNRFDSEDALQNVYLKIKSNIRSYRPGTNGLAWILEIAKNTALNELRAEASRRKQIYRGTAYRGTARRMGIQAQRDSRYNRLSHRNGDFEI